MRSWSSPTSHSRRAASSRAPTRLVSPSRRSPSCVRTSSRTRPLDFTCYHRGRQRHVYPGGMTATCRQQQTAIKRRTEVRARARRVRAGTDPARRHGTATVRRSARVMLARWRNGVSSSAAHTFAGGSRALSYSLRERDWSPGLASSRPRSCRTGATSSSPISSGRSSRPLRPRAEAHRRVRQSRVPQRRVLGRRS